MYFKRDYSYLCADKSEMNINIFYPENYDFSKKLPAIILFFGGGWHHGAPIYIEPQAKFFASRGMIVITPEYRIFQTHKNQPTECVKDAKLAVKWVYDNADMLGIDKEKIVLSGSSAGGHLAICASLISPIDNDDIDVTHIPKAQLLFNPVLDSSENGFVPSEFKTIDLKNISPIHNLKNNLPPTAIFHGTDDEIVAYSQATTFCELTNKMGNPCTLYTYPGKKHGFNTFRTDIVSFADVMSKCETFLREQEIIN